MTPDMPGPEQLKPKDLVVGGRYLHVNRLFIRQIDAIEGDTASGLVQPVDVLRTMLDFDACQEFRGVGCGLA